MVPTKGETSSVAQNHTAPLGVLGNRRSLALGWDLPSSQSSMQLVSHSCKPGLAQEPPLHSNLEVVAASPGKPDWLPGAACCSHCRNQNLLNRFLFPFPGLLLDLGLLLPLVFLQLCPLP